MFNCISRSSGHLSSIFRKMMLTFSKMNGFFNLGQCSELETYSRDMTDSVSGRSNPRVVFRNTCFSQLNTRRIALLIFHSAALITEHYLFYIYLAHM